jgi:hypothetical protein
VIFRPWVLAHAFARIRQKPHQQRVCKSLRCSSRLSLFSSAKKNCFWASLCVRLSQTKEIQLAFQQEVARIYNEVGAGDGAPIEIPTTVADIIDGQGFRKSLDGMEQKGTLETAGFRPEHIRILKSLAFFLGHCSLLSATPQNLAVCEPLFHPAHPITPEAADAFDEIIAAIVDNTK